ncbi:hypothetical protein BSL82_04600 [Tardibacter chloracetimidivorans]|uniref:Short chain dehydrogenase n=2 Tax=Tardibacter chloracetimidivorans TaxID=1921510 RepID=A0A1L3ZSU9_9SPHN|nr:hypothetical protein BSL82_04600 [Tardibacter chloracetimidivorans]
MGGDGQRGVEWTGKVALVTGAGSGIGQASAEAFARAGAKVAVVDLDVAGGERVVENIKAAGGEAFFIASNVSDENAVKEMVAETLSRYGRLDAAHNNAGISPDTGLTADCPFDVWNQVMAVNLTGTWLCMKHQIPALLAGGGGAIVNTGSVNSIKGAPKLSAYAASKHGLVGLTRTAAIEYAAQNIRVNMICPGITLTPMLEKKAAEVDWDLKTAHQMVPIDRLAAPNEMAEAAVWLCSTSASYITGVVLSVDGGMTLN